MPRPPTDPVVVSAAAAEVLRALLALDPDVAREVRERSRRRTRPRRQVGPSADHGEE